MTVSELVDRLDMAELAEWMAFLRLKADPRAFNGVEDNLVEAFRSFGGKR